MPVPGSGLARSLISVLMLPIWAPQGPVGLVLEVTCHALHLCCSSAEGVERMRPVSPLTMRAAAAMPRRSVRLVSNMWLRLYSSELRVSSDALRTTLLIFTPVYGSQDAPNPPLQIHSVELVVCQTS
jgi:hypothetical protein